MHIYIPEQAKAIIDYIYCVIVTRILTMVVKMIVLLIIIVISRKLSKQNDKGYIIK